MTGLCGGQVIMEAAARPALVPAPEPAPTPGSDSPAIAVTVAETRRLLNATGPPTPAM